MKNWRSEFIALAIVVLICGASARRLAVARSFVAAPEARAFERLIVEGHASPESRGAAAIVARNPFRLSRQPAIPALSSNTNASLPYRPTLQVMAVIGGPPWRALITGVPGAARPTLVTPGARIDSLDVLGIWRDTVRLRGPDTTWTLVIPRKNQ